MSNSIIWLSTLLTLITAPVLAEVSPESVLADLKPIIGVSPEDQHLYNPIIEAGSGKRTWKCLGNPEIVLSYDQINDNYCDCPDGLDEPGTNACPYNEKAKFYCANNGHIPGYIENYKLNDGVCDYDICCDGSDEYQTGKCENKCPQIHQQYVEYSERVKKDIEKSLQIKTKLIEIAQIRKTEDQNKLKELKEALAKKTNDLEQLQQATVDQTEDNKDIGLVFDKLSPHINELTHQVTKHHDNLLKQENKILHLEKILAALTKNYNPNFNDAAVKESVNKFQEYVSNKEDELVEQIEDTHRLLEALAQKSKKITCTPHDQPDVIETPSLARLIHHYVSYIAENYLNRFLDKRVDALDYSPLFTEETPSMPSSEAIEKLEKEIKSLQMDVSILEDDLKTDYGPNDILRSLVSSRVAGKIGEYNYNLGFVDTITQDDVLIGRFLEFKDNTLVYKNGAKCWNGPSRSAVVELICGPHNKLLTVSEPEKCEYLFELVTPIICEPFTEDEIFANFKIDHSRL